MTNAVVAQRGGEVHDGTKQRGVGSRAENTESHATLRYERSPGERSIKGGVGSSAQW